MIELRHIERRYKAGHADTWELRRIDMKIDQWEFVAVMTIVQVTKSEENARFGPRAEKLRDGWLTRDTKVDGKAEEASAH